MPIDLDLSNLCIQIISVHGPFTLCQWHTFTIVPEATEKDMNASRKLHDLNDLKKNVLFTRIYSLSYTHLNMDYPPISINHRITKCRASPLSCSIKLIVLIERNDWQNPLILRFLTVAHTIIRLNCRQVDETNTEK